MFELGINYCDCSGPMAACKMKNQPLNQELCDYSDCKNGSCIFHRKDMGGHCDNSEAQHNARGGPENIPQRPLNEEEVFDVRNGSTYPRY